MFSDKSQTGCWADRPKDQIWNIISGRELSIICKDFFKCSFETEPDIALLLFVLPPDKIGCLCHSGMGCSQYLDCKLQSDDQHHQNFSYEQDKKHISCWFWTSINNLSERTKMKRMHHSKNEKTKTLPTANTNHFALLICFEAINTQLA